MSGRVMIIDAVADSRTLMKARLATACYDPLAVADGEGALRLAREAAPDAILIDIDAAAPAGAAPGRGGIDVLRRLRADRRCAQVPLVALASGDDAERRIAALGAGADDVLARGVADDVLFARLRSLMRGRAAARDFGGGAGLAPGPGLAEAATAFACPTSGTGAAAAACAPADGQGTVALVLAPRAAQALRARLGLLLPARVIVLDRAAALAQDGLAVCPDLYVIDADLDGPGGGLRLMASLRSRGAGLHAAYVLLRPQREAGPADATAYDMGAHDLADPEVDARELALRLTALLRRKRAEDGQRQALREQLRLAMFDALTGLHNRHYAFPQLEGMASAARLDGAGFAVLILDLDRFKAVNDRHGHGAGDAVLVEVARRLASAMRQGQLLARIGGEEFLVALPRADTARAGRIARRLADAIRAEPVVLADGTEVAVTVSVGLAACWGRALAPRTAVGETFERADRALMRAKAAGRDRVECAEEAA